MRPPVTIGTFVLFIALAIPAGATTLGGVSYDIDLAPQDVGADTSAVGAAPVDARAKAKTQAVGVSGDAPACDVEMSDVQSPSCRVEGPATSLGGAPVVSYDVAVDLPFQETPASEPVRDPSIREMVAYGGAYEISVQQLAAAAAATGAATGLLYLAWRAVKAGGMLALVPLATHLKASELLDDPHRKAIYTLIQSEPGIATKDIADRLGLAWGTVTHHLLKLEKARFVVSQKFGKYRRYFINGSGIEQKEQVAVLKVARTGDVVTYVRANPGASQKEVSHGMGVSSSTVLWHVKRLMKVGVLDKVRDGKSVRYYVKDGPMAGAPVSPSPPMVVTDAPF